MTTITPVTVGIGALSVEDVVAVARYGANVEIDPAALEEIAATRERIEELAADPTPVYGVSTGFGALATKHIPEDMRAQLQVSLVRSHAAGSGPEVEEEVIRALMLLRLSTLCTGRTGVRPVVAETYAAALNAGITPVVREFGSLGCSGDLAPLAHCALALLGEGEVRVKGGEIVPAADALAQAGIEPLVLREKEGLALINGTDGMLGMLCLAIADLREAAKVSDIATAMSVEGLNGTLSVFDDDLQQLRPHPGQADAAYNIRTVAADSPILAAALEDFKANDVQDAYSIRCTPQVAGGFRDTLTYVTTVADRELAAANDNPVVAKDGRVASNGNFHGAPVAYVLDFLAIVVADLASISERRTDRFLDPARNRGLNAFLAGDPGVDSGHMIAQYTQAGIVGELKRNAVPASADSIPSSAMQEDHVSMGWSAGRKLRRSIDGLQRVLAVEILTAARALDMREGEPSVGTGAALATLRKHVEGPGTDRFLAPEIEHSVHLVKGGDYVTAVEAVVGTLR